MPSADLQDDSGPLPGAAVAGGREQQIFPTFEVDELARMVRFGRRQQWHDGDCVFEAGGHCPGLVVVLEGAIAVFRRNGMGGAAAVALIHRATHGQFTGEVAQLSGRPPLASGRAEGAVDAMVFDADALRALLIGEAELGERIMRALILRRVGLIDDRGGGPVLIGPSNNAATFQLQNFLSSNAQPYLYLDPAVPADALACAALLAVHQPGPADWPLVVCADGSVRRHPALRSVAHRLGMLPQLPEDALFDVAVVGAGPAGLATAVYAASEGLSVLVLEQHAYGGQAGASARIENYLGFPTGVSGRALAGRAHVQALKFGAQLAIPAPALRLLCDAAPFSLVYGGVRACGVRAGGVGVDAPGGDSMMGDDGADRACTVRARAVVLASGARYRRPPLAALARFEGRGVYYWASPIEARLCRGQPVLLVGGGNSAGQAAVFLARHASCVHMLIRGGGLAATMSRYLVERIAATANIALHPHSQVAALDGDDEGLQAVTVTLADGSERRYQARCLFLFIGADPNTEWLGDCGVQVDDKGFVCTGGDGAAGLETSVPGVFAIGDVRAGSTKRVAAAVGEGAAVVAQLHRYLADLEETAPRHD